MPLHRALGSVLPQAGCSVLADLQNNPAVEQIFLPCKAEVGEAAFQMFRHPPCTEVVTYFQIPSKQIWGIVLGGRFPWIASSLEGKCKSLPAFYQGKTS